MNAQAWAAILLFALAVVGAVLVGRRKPAPRLPAPFVARRSVVVSYVCSGCGAPTVAIPGPRFECEEGPGAGPMCRAVERHELAPEVQAYRTTYLRDVIADRDTSDDERAKATKELLAFGEKP